MEYVYHLVLLALAVWGALRAGIFVAATRWPWYVKIAIAMVIVSAVGGYLRQITGGPVTDFRPVTKLLASAGCVYAVEYGFRQVADNRYRAGMVAAAGLFLYLTWVDTVDRIMAQAQS